MKRLFDLILSVIVLLILAIPMLLIALAVFSTSRGSIIYWSNRVGQDNVNFLMPKFRTMREDTPTIATHLMNDAENYLTRIGGFLRSSSLDETPQIFSILKGEMSFVGPRPALFNQHDLIILRTKKGVDKLKPGVTGWAQINGRDELTILEKVDFDVEYLNLKSLKLDLKILWVTILKVISRINVAH
jgi:O-antigen biosynthesis protein WbqP